MTNGLISRGPPPLTEGAADAALDLIDFMAAAVRGVDTRVGEQQQRLEEAAKVDPEAAAQIELYNHSVNLQMLTNMSTIGANNTIGLMQAYNRMS